MEFLWNEIPLKFQRKNIIKKFFRNLGYFFELIIQFNNNLIYNILKIILNKNLN